MVATDAIRLARKSREALNEIEKFGCLERLHEGPDANDGEIYTCMILLRQIFYSLTVIRNKAQVTLSQLQKLSSNSAFAACFS